MNTSQIKAYAPKARRDFIQAITDKANLLGLSENEILPAEVQGDVAIIAGTAYPKKTEQLRQKIISRINVEGFNNVMESIAYTWFNRFIALRYMELHDYLEHGYRVLSNRSGSDIPEILEKATEVNLPGLDKDKVVELRLAGNKDNELYKLLILAQCHALHKSMPFLFEPIDDETELLMPDNLLHSNSPIRKMVNEIDEENWNEVEIVGWIYQFYISEKKDKLMKAKKAYKPEDIPAVTQLFTPNWIVKYLTQNSLGRTWVATYPDSPLKQKMEYYIEPAEQEPEVQKQLEEITPKHLDTEEITVLDPACGSGHILVEAYNIFKDIYLERGYTTREIPRLILEKNLYGLEIDDRAAQLAGFAVLMQARADDKDILKNPPELNILSIQQSNGIDAEKIAEALVGSSDQISMHNDVQLKEEIDSESQVLKQDIKNLVEFFQDAKTYGSLLGVPEKTKCKINTIETLVNSKINNRDTYSTRAAKNLKPFLKQAELISWKYDCVIANPPYMGSKYLNSKLKDYVNMNFPTGKSDLFAAFIDKGFNYTKSYGYNSMVTMQSWMFLSSFEQLRGNILKDKTITTIAHLGARAFGSISGEVVQTTANNFLNYYIHNFKPSFFRLVEGNEKKKLQLLKARKQLYDRVSIDDFKKIPGEPIAYWIKQSEINLYKSGKYLKDFCELKKGMDTGNNEKFLRMWFEVNISTISYNGKQYNLKWFPYNKGGEFRRWYGNRDFLVNWFENGREIKSRLNLNAKKPTIRSEKYYFREGYTWTTVSSGGFSIRYTPKGALFDNGGCTLFIDEELHHFGAFLNSTVANRYLSFLCPTLNFQPGDVGKILYKEVNNKKPELIEHSLVNISRQDWDSYETSWDFEKIPWVTGDLKGNTVQESFSNWKQHSIDQTQKMKELEEENNRIFIEAYGLEDELTPEIPEEQITLTINPKYRYGTKYSENQLWNRFREDSIKELISYSVGCMMGRYSLDEPGLIYAHEGNKDFNPSKYKSFPADDDGIIPLTEQDWFPDDATNRFIQFLKVVWDEDSLDENIEFVAESLGKRKSESQIDTIRRYFSNDFFKDHMRTYKKRPIYWLFSSGKNKAFECLVYLHRYNEATLSRMRSEYVTPLQGKINTRIDFLNNEFEHASSTSEKKKLEKELSDMKKKQEELKKFDEELRHYADKRIKLDLDDGVKVNYGKFGNLLAEVKKIT